MILEATLVVVTGGLAVIATRHVCRQKLDDATEAAAAAESDRDAAESALNQTANLAGQLNHAFAEVDWMRRQQSTYHVDMCRWRDRLMAWQADLDAQQVAAQPAPVTTGPMSTAALRAQFDTIVQEGGAVDHITSVYGDQPHFLGAMPDDLHGVLDKAESGPVWHDDFVDALTGGTGELPAVGTDEDADLGPDPVVEEPAPVEGRKRGAGRKRASARDRRWGPSVGGDGRPDDDAVTLPGGGEPKLSGQPDPGTGPTDDVHGPQQPKPGKVPALVIRESLLGLIAVEDERRQADLVSAAVTR